LPNTNIVSEAITTVIGEYKTLLKESAKTGNKVDKISGGNKGEEMLQNLFNSKGLDLSRMRRL
jgi:hypothetical protein|tara:strand:+ start:812 stop:1000 length:189 start_codon:yes stop_codon:yes gene_type:complete